MDINTAQQKIYLAVLVIFLCSRIIELFISKRNERTLSLNGVIYSEKDSYVLMVLLHTSWFIFQAIEFFLVQIDINFQLVITIIGILIFTQSIRLWTMITLKSRWVTKVCIGSRREMIKAGPYRYLKHPNYAIVYIEICLLPLMGGAFITMAIFTVLNIIVLKRRIKIEDEFLMAHSTLN